MITIELSKCFKIPSKSIFLPISIIFLTSKLKRNYNVFLLKREHKKEELMVKFI